MENVKAKGRVTIPTDLDVVAETKELLECWGADAIRDCDGTDYPEELKKYILLIIQREKIMSGQKRILMKFSRCTL